MLKIYTASISYLRIPDALDITAQSATLGKPFAPSWKMVKELREKWTMTTAQFEAQYRKMMSISRETHKDFWESIEHQDRIVLCCYCKPFEFCHRFILKDILRGEYMGEIEIGNEIWSKYKGGDKR